MQLWFRVLLISVPVGLGLSAISPEKWGFGPVEGILLGPVIYLAALKRFVERHANEPMRSGARWLGPQGILPGLLFRAILFIALLAGQAYLCFEGLPGADVRRGFVILSSWVIAQSLIDPVARRRAGPAVDA